MECWRVLKSDGTLWFNMGDSYAGSGKSSGHDNTKSRINYSCNVFTKTYHGRGIKPKNLIGIPWSLAIIRGGISAKI